MQNFYYTAPSDAAFDDMKTAALTIWNTYDDPYRSEKVNAIKNILNIRDNFMYMFAMFDGFNQRKCADLLKIDTRHDVRERLRAGGAGEYQIMQILGV